MKKQSKPGDMFNKTKKGKMNSKKKSVKQGIKDVLSLTGNMGKAFAKNAVGRDSKAILKNKRPKKK